MPPESGNNFPPSDEECIEIWRRGVERARRYLDATDQPYPEHLNAALEYLETGQLDEYLLRNPPPATNPDAPKERNAP